MSQFTPSRKPVNIQVMDVDEFVRLHRAKEVTVSFVMEPSSTRFHPNGLYSEEIFGLSTSPERMIKFGYISLGIPILNSVVYFGLVRLKRLYEQIMSGKQYAIFSEDNGDFFPAPEGAANANTGYSFFLKHVPKLRFNESASLSRTDIVQLFDKYADRLTQTKCLVAPAGLRDYRTDPSGRSGSEDINKLYNSLLSLTRAMPSKGGDDPIFDLIRFSIQKKVNETYLYLENIVFGSDGGKSGLMQSKLGARATALSGRNVITAARMAATSPTDPTFHRIDETKTPLYMTAKEFMPLTVHAMSKLFFNTVFQTDNEKVSLIDPDGMRLRYFTIRNRERLIFSTPTGMRKLITLFEDDVIRSLPVVVPTEEGPIAYVYLVYDEGDSIYVFRSLDTFKQMMAGRNRAVDESKIRPLTMMELIYISTWMATINRTCTITRYPVVGTDSIYPSKIHLMSTNRSRVVKLRSELNDMELQLPEYPIIGASFIGSIVLHPSRLQGLGGDHDGDQVVMHSILTDDARDETLAVLDHISSYVTSNRELVVGANTDLLGMTIYSLLEPQGVYHGK